MLNKKPRIMKAETLHTPKGREEVRTILQKGELLAFPTETVYGVGCDGFSSGAVDKLIQAKQRGPGHPFSLHLGSQEQVFMVVEEISAEVEKLMDSFWPGPLTLILPRFRDLPQGVTGGLKTIGLRLPDHWVARELACILGRPLAATSANVSGRPSPTSSEHVLRDLANHLALVVDGGPCTLGVESTVLDLSCSPPLLRRPGTVTREDIEEVLGFSLQVAQEHGKAYRPAVPVYIIGDMNQASIPQWLKEKGFSRPGLLGFIGQPPEWAWKSLPLPGDIQGLSSMYRYLRDLEEVVDVILISPPASGPFQELIHNRLQRAAVGWLENRGEGAI